jgi:hypothetical protein
MGVFMTVLASILVLLSNFLIWHFNKGKLRGGKVWFLVVLAILTVALIWLKDYSQNKETTSLRKNITNITDQNKLLISSSDSLTKRLSDMQQDMAQMRKENQELASSLEPFKNIANRIYPGISAEIALQKLASDISKNISKDISKIKPKLVYLGQIGPQRDPVSGLFQTSYDFSSDPTHALKDVRIRVKFDGCFVFITGGKRGLIGAGAELLTPYRDSTGFSYATGYMPEDNNIRIEVKSKNPLAIDSMGLSAR